MNLKHLLLPIALLTACTTQTDELEFHSEVWVVDLDLSQSSEYQSQELTKFLRAHHQTKDTNPHSLGNLNTDHLVEDLKMLTDSKLLDHPTIAYSKELPGYFMIINGDKSFELTMKAQYDVADKIHLELDGTIMNKQEACELKGSADMSSNETIMLDHLTCAGKNMVVFIRVQDAN